MWLDGAVACNAGSLKLRDATDTCLARELWRDLMNDVKYGRNFSMTKDAKRQKGEGQSLESAQRIRIPLPSVDACTGQAAVVFLCFSRKPNVTTVCRYFSRGLKPMLSPSGRKIYNTYVRACNLYSLI